MLILVDMDDVIADCEGAFLKEYQRRFPQAPFIPKGQRTTFYFSTEYPEARVFDIAGSPGFFRSFDPLPGAIDALNAMQADGHTIRICTSPFAVYRHCVVEKCEWVEMHLGREWVDRIILTFDKTVVHGDILIDDNPRITGASAPTWEHILFDQSYNRHIANQRRLHDWSGWRELFPV